MMGASVWGGKLVDASMDTTREATTAVSDQSVPFWIEGWMQRHRGLQDGLLPFAGGFNLVSRLRLQLVYSGWYMYEKGCLEGVWRKLEQKR
jgi:hypothetical protein